MLQELSRQPGLYGGRFQIKSIFSSLYLGNVLNLSQKVDPDSESIRSWLQSIIGFSLLLLKRTLQTCWFRGYCVSLANQLDPFPERLRKITKFLVRLGFASPLSVSQNNLNGLVWGLRHLPAGIETQKHRLKYIGLICFSFHRFAS